MQIIRISDIHHPRFGEVWHLYQNSFPLCEQRTLDHQITAFKADRFHLDVYLDGETLVGFIGYWDFDDYLYIEHYAINSTCGEAAGAVAFSKPCKKPPAKRLSSKSTK